MTEEELYPTRARVRVLTGKLDGVLTRSQLADVEMLGNCIDIFGDDCDEPTRTEEEKALRQTKRMLVHNMEAALKVIESLSQKVGKSKRTKAS